MSKLQLGVFFGSRSCEREVSIISALQMMNHVDTEKYDVVPVYIDQDGAWYTGPALRELRTFAPFHADAKGVENVNLDLTSGSGALLAYRPGKGLFTPAKLEVVARLDVCFLVLHGLHGEDGALQGLLEFTAHCNRQRTANLLLLYDQNPAITMARTFEAWRQAGRSV